MDHLYAPWHQCGWGLLLRCHFDHPYAQWAFSRLREVFCCFACISLPYKRPHRSVSIVNRLIAVVVSTGLITAIFGLLAIITVRVFLRNTFLFNCFQLATLPNTLVYGAVTFVVCTLYCNSVLANLNARSFIRDGSGISHTSSPQVMREAFDVHAVSESRCEYVLGELGQGDGRKVRSAAALGAVREHQA